MALLGDILLGLSRTVPGVIDDIESRQEKERKRQEIEAERKRQEMIAEQLYQRGRMDRIADTEDQRAHNQRLLDEEINRKAIEKARAEAERTDAIAGAVGARNGVTAEQVQSRARGGMMEPAQMPGPWQEGLTAEAEQDPDKARKVFSQFNEVLNRVKAGEQTGSVFKDMDARDEKARKDAMTPEEVIAAGRREKILKGGNPDLDAAREQLIEAQTAALLNKAEGGGSGGRNTDPDFRKRLAIYDGQVKRAEAVEESIRKSLNAARDEMDGAKEGGSIWARAKKKADRYEAELAAANKRTDEARTKYAEFDAGGSSARSSAAPAVLDEEARSNAAARTSPIDMARAEAVTSNQPVQYDIGGKRGTFAAGTGAEQAAPAKPLPPAPREPSQRKVGEIYSTPRGPLMWMGNGWKVVD